MRDWKRYEGGGSRSRFWPKAAIILVVIFAVVGGTVLITRPEAREPDNNEAETEGTGISEDITSANGTYIFSGTIVLGRAVEQAAETAGGYDYSQPFSGLGSLNYDQYDAGVIDLECPSTGRRVSYEESVANLVFDCHPDWFDELGKYYQIMNVAGNHTYDAGADGFTKTVANIQDAGMQAVGHYSPRETDDICEIVDIPVRLQKTDGKEEQGVLPIAMCSYHYQFAFEPEPGELEKVQQYAEVMPVIGLMHAGAEYQPVSSSEQQEYARAMIDNGAEFVIGNGAHWVQDTEVYKDKLIVYSTGNFIFDQIEYESRLGLSIAASMKAEYNKNLAGWLELGGECSGRDDACFRSAKDKNLKPYNPDFNFEAISTFGGYQRVTEKATPEQEADILERANWQETIEELGQG